MPSGRSLAALGRLALASLGASLLGLSASVASATPISDLVISEVMFAPVSDGWIGDLFDANDGRQWVEIYNGTGTTVDLSSYRLEWGEDSLTSSVDLSGLLSPGTTVLIGGPISDGSNGNPSYDQVYDFDPSLGSGDSPFLGREDGVALVEIATGSLLHILVYGGDGVPSGFVDEQGAPAPVTDVSGLGPGQSLEYTGSSWQLQGAPTPGSPSAGLAIPQPGSGPLLAAALLGLALARRPDRR